MFPRIPKLTRDLNIANIRSGIEHIYNPPIKHKSHSMLLVKKSNGSRLFQDELKKGDVVVWVLTDVGSSRSLMCKCSWSHQNKEWSVECDEVDSGEIEVVSKTNPQSVRLEWNAGAPTHNEYIWTLTKINDEFFLLCNFEKIGGAWTNTVARTIGESGFTAFV